MCCEGDSALAIVVSCEESVILWVLNGEMQPALRGGLKPSTGIGRCARAELLGILMLYFIMHHDKGLLDAFLYYKALEPRGLVKS